MLKHQLCFAVWILGHTDGGAAIVWDIGHYDREGVGLRTILMYDDDRGEGKRG